MNVVLLLNSFNFDAPTYVQVDRTPPRTSNTVFSTGPRYSISTVFPSEALQFQYIYRYYRFKCWLINPSVSYIDNHYFQSKQYLVLFGHRSRDMKSTFSCLQQAITSRKMINIIDVCFKITSDYKNYSIISLRRLGYSNAEQTQQSQTQHDTICCSISHHTRKHSLYILLKFSLFSIDLERPWISFNIYSRSWRPNKNLYFAQSFTKVYFLKVTFVDQPNLWWI